MPCSCKRRTYPATARVVPESQQRVRVTHPFHPWRGRELEVVDVRRYGGDDLLYSYDDDGWLVSVPRSWTDMGELEPFREWSAGRAQFRLEDLKKLLALVEGIEGARGAETCK